MILSIRIHLYKKGSDPLSILRFVGLTRAEGVRSDLGSYAKPSPPLLCFPFSRLSEPTRKGIDGFGHSIQDLKLRRSFLSESYLTESMESSAPQRFDIFQVFSRYCGEWGRRTMLSCRCVLRVAFPFLTALIFVFSFVIWRCNLGKSCLFLFLSIIAYWCVKFCLSYFGWIYFFILFPFFISCPGKNCLENQEFNWVLLCWLNRTKREKRWTSVGWLCCWDELCFDLEIFDPQSHLICFLRCQLMCSRCWVYNPPLSLILCKKKEKKNYSGWVGYCSFQNYWVQVGWL